MWVEAQSREVVTSATLGGHTLALNLVALVGTPNSAEMKQLSVSMNDYQLVKASDRITYERATATNSQTLRMASLRADLPHELHFGNSLADMLTDLKAIKRAVSSEPLAARAVVEAAQKAIPTFTVVCDSVRLSFATTRWTAG